MHIVWLGETPCLDPARVGGKAANLSALAQTHPVPPGFCITTTALTHPPSVNAAPTPDALPGHLREELGSAYRRLETRCQSPPLRMAVRSSTADEDGSHASFAGQHLTDLNVVGFDLLCTSVVRCWASAYTDQARAYRRAQGKTINQIQLGVLVQELIPADVSFVAFSANPLNGRANEAVVNASWGLGESVVSGEVTPDVYVLDKRTGATIQATLGNKHRMTVLGKRGTRLAAVPRLLQARACLTPEQLRQVLELSTTLEGQMGWPVDVEGAFLKNRLYLLQCRPITTLNQKETPQ